MQILSAQKLQLEKKQQDCISKTSNWNKRCKYLCAIASFSEKIQILSVQNVQLEKKCKYLCATATFLFRTMYLFRATATFFFRTMFLFRATATFFLRTMYFFCATATFYFGTMYLFCATASFLSNYTTTDNQRGISGKR